MAAAVSDDVMEEILSKLPVKSLLRFTCACKTWYSTISDPRFSKLIMRPGILMVENLGDFSTITIESLVKKDRATTPVSFPWETEEVDRKRVSYPWETEEAGSKNTCLGSCNGLICVDHRNSSTRGLTVCNLSTRKFKTLPRPRRYLHFEWWTYSWFGYDESIDDYKIVWLNFSDLPCRAELDVFTLKSSNTWNTWRRRAVDQMAVGYLTNRRGVHSIFTGGVLCNKAIHWITDYFPTPERSERVILVLDLATEECRLLNISHAPLHPGAWIGSSDGECLWLWNHVKNAGVFMSELSVMKESSWTKLLSIRCHRNFLDYPILFSKEKQCIEMVVMCTVQDRRSERIVKLRVEEGKVTHEILLDIPRNPLSRYIFTPYVIQHMEESLVPI